MNDRIPVRWLRVAFTAAAAALVAMSVMPLAGQGSPAGTRAAAGQANDPAREDWIQLFDGRDLAGWTPKFAKHDLGVNLNDTFRAEGGLLRVRYDKWAAFNNEFGHLFYKQPFSYYRVVAEYRFVDTQLAGGPGWAQRNSGIMLHLPAPGDAPEEPGVPRFHRGAVAGRRRRPETPADHGESVHPPHGRGHGRQTPHAALHQLQSPRPTMATNQSLVEVEVHGAERIQHIVEGQVVLEYTQPQIGGGNVSPVDPKVKVDGTPLTGGFIAIQAETGPTDFRKIELLNLEGCADPKASNYKSYVVKSNPKNCRY